MATEFNTEAELLANLKTEFGAINVGVSVEETARTPYYNHVGVNWVINASCLDRLYKICVRDVSGLDETTIVKEVYYVKAKLDGKCWYLGRVPRQEGVETFRYEVLEFFKQSLPNYCAPQIISQKEYFNGDKEKSTAIVVVMKNTDVLGIYKIYYSGGNITQDEITTSYDEVKKYIELYKGE